MSNESKLHVLHRAYEVEEQKALEEKKKVSEKVNERQKIVDELLRERNRMQAAIREWRTKGRVSALRGGEAWRLASGASFETRIAAELAVLEERLRNKTEELNRAIERAKLADDDWKEARLDKKRLEKVMDNRYASELAVDVAREEIDADELSFFGRDKK